MTQSLFSHFRATFLNFSGVLGGTHFHNVRTLSNVVASVWKPRPSVSCLPSRAVVYCAPLELRNVEACSRSMAWDSLSPEHPSAVSKSLVYCRSRNQNLAHRNRGDFCDLRLRCPSQTPEIARFLRQDKKNMLHCDLRVRWKVASDLRFRAAISAPKTPSFCGISGDLAQSTRKSLAIKD